MNPKVKSNDAYIKDYDILAIMDPEEQFEEYYLNAAARIKSILESQNETDELNEDHIQDIFESMKLDKNQIIH
jgi:predicted RNA-binding protein associated with RNAse of E/G family